MAEKQITVADIIAKRKELWKAYLDGEKPNQDEEFIGAAIRKILSTDSLRAEIMERPYLLIESVFTVVDKKKKTVPFFLNTVQSDFIAQYEEHGKTKPYFILKGRQQGFTTVITAIQLSYALVQKNFSGFTLANVEDNTMSIFNDKARVVYDRLPAELKPHEKFNSKKELFFDTLNSSWRIATATKDVGRSKTLNFIHYSEVAFFGVSLGDLQSSIGEAATADCFIVYETTANGFNEAKDLWDSGSCINLFYEWWKTPEYVTDDFSYLETNDKWLKERINLLYKLGLNKNQVAWYAKKYNGYLDKQKIKQEYPITPDEAFISSGECVFDKEQVANRLIEVRNLQPVKKGYFKYRRVTEIVKNSNGEEIDEHIKLEDIEFVIDEINGYISIHEEPQVKRQNGTITHQAPYSLGGDTSGSGSDYNTGKVISNMTQKTVATLRKQVMDDDLYAEQMYCLGKYFNWALIGIEVNFSIQATKYLAQRLHYPKLYMREKISTISKERLTEYGFATTPKTRPVILSDLVALVREDVSIESDEATLREMLTFIKVEVSPNHFRQEAQVGYHDDLIMALAIAHYISEQQTSSWIEVVSNKTNFIKENFNMQSAGNNSDFMSW